MQNLLHPVLVRVQKRQILRQLIPQLHILLDHGNRQHIQYKPHRQHQIHRSSADADFTRAD
ncbi:hypothetical protein D3C76_1543800 [compost metagenome]